MHTASVFTASFSPPLTRVGEEEEKMEDRQAAAFMYLYVDVSHQGEGVSGRRWGGRGAGGAGRCLAINQHLSIRPADTLSRMKGREAQGGQGGIIAAYDIFFMKHFTLGTK